MSPLCFYSRKDIQLCGYGEIYYCVMFTNYLSGSMPSLVAINVAISLNIGAAT